MGTYVDQTDGPDAATAFTVNNREASTARTLTFFTGLPFGYCRTPLLVFQQNLPKTATCCSKLPEPTASEGREEEGLVSAAVPQGGPLRWLPRYNAALKSDSRPSEPRR